MRWRGEVSSGAEGASRGARGAKDSQAGKRRSRRHWGGFGPGQDRHRRVETRPSRPGRQYRFVPFERRNDRGGRRRQQPRADHHGGGPALGSLVGLVTIYVDDLSGGAGPTPRLRDLVTTQVRRLAEIDGQLRLALAQDDSAKILSSITDISSVLVEVQHVRAQLGLAVSRAGSSRGQTKRAAA